MKEHGEVRTSAIVNCIKCCDLLSKGVIEFGETTVEGPEERKEFCIKGYYKGLEVIGVGTSKKKAKAAIRTYFLHGEPCQGENDKSWRKENEIFKIHTYDPENSHAYAKNSYPKEGKFAFTSKKKVKSALVEESPRTLLLTRESKVLYEALIRHETRKEKAKQVDQFCVTCSSGVQKRCSCKRWVCQTCEVRCHSCGEEINFHSTGTTDKSIAMDIDSILLDSAGLTAKQIANQLSVLGYERKGLKKRINQYLYSAQEIYYQDDMLRWSSYYSDGW